LAAPAEAKIVYTPAHHVIGKNGYFGIDFNHDGIPDLGIHNSSFRYANYSVDVVGASPADSENAGIKSGVYNSSWPGSFLLPALRRGALIGPGGGFIYSKGVMVGQCAHGTSNSGPPCSSDRYHTLGSWANVKNRYLGVTFTARGKTHYGWARLTVELSRKPFKATAILTGYAYETIPNKPIVAGKTHGKDVITVEPATLGHLARGASGLSAWRRTNSVAATH